jgi:GT2 family glycosyltransferase
MEERLREYLKHELLCEHRCEDEQKDILIVVRDQLHHIRACVESIFDTTDNFRLYIWDNGSAPPTRDYLWELAETFQEVELHRREENSGFIEPNNYLAAHSESPYLILLNSDTEVSEGWDRAMLGYLQAHPETGAVGYMGGLLDGNGRGVGVGFGTNFDYLMGWCLCLPRITYKTVGLFDDVNLQFAYFEDADLSLRLREAGKGLYALHLGYVYHAGNATILDVKEERDTTTAFRCNRDRICRRWSTYLDQHRILLHPPSGVEIRK